jgi:predicted Na+-dependent transporter
MKALNKITSIFLSLIFVLAPAAMVQAGEAKGEVGVVTCEYISGTKTNMLLFSKASFNCVFKHDGVQDQYDGEAGIRLGLDLQWSATSTMAYTVMASTQKDIDWSQALTGTYTGGKASAAFGVGLGAAVLIGGSSDSVALVPLAIEVGTGFGATAGLGFLSLKGK